MARGQREYQ